MIKKINHDGMRKIALNYIPRKSSIVEVGCSSGNFAELIQNAEHQYIGIDVNSGKINEAKELYPDMEFINCDITKNLKLLKKGNVIVSFQCLEHIKEDLKILKAITSGSTVILSVPNRKYKGHVRWFELNGWINRFKPFIDIEETITIQHPVKPGRRSFLIKGKKNGKKKD